MAERTFAWISCFRRLSTRYERLLTTYKAFFDLAWALITLRHF
ncbi:MAG: transposase [Deltaproteobacteria bacterium]|nr:transposase [Deltaproteobacteria bacterium]